MYFFPKVRKYCFYIGSFVTFGKYFHQVQTIVTYPIGIE